MLELRPVNCLFDFMEICLYYFPGNFESVKLRNTSNETAESPVGDNYFDNTMSKTLDESGLSTNITVAGIVKIILSC